MSPPAKGQATPPHPLALLIATGALLLLSGFVMSLEQGAVRADLRLPDGGWLVLARMVSDMGNFYVLLPLVLLSATLWRNRDEVQDLLVFMIASGLLCQVLKLIVARPRPDLVHFDSWPSGHAAAALSFALALWRRPVSARALAILFATLIGTCRVLVGRHWPGDVVAGFAVAVLISSLARMPRVLPAALLQTPRRLAIVAGLVLFHLCNLAFTSKIDKFKYQAAAIVVVLVLTLELREWERELSAAAGKAP